MRLLLCRVRLVLLVLVFVGTGGVPGFFTSTGAGVGVGGAVGVGAGMLAAAGSVAPSAASHAAQPPRSACTCV